MKSRLLRRAAPLTLAALLLGALPLVPAGAAAPQVRTQAPGWYRTMLGGFEVTVLSDGSHTFPVDTVFEGIERAGIDAALARQDLERPVQGSINGFLINTGSRLVLVDAGAGSLYGPCCGRLLANLRASGYAPEQVDLVLLTHLHKDHVGGIVDGAKAVFPNAVVRAARADADYWTSSQARREAPDFLASFFDSARAALAPYAEAGRFRPFDPDDGAELAPGIRAQALPGHTPGHTAYLVENGGRSLLLWGDLVHVTAIQLEHPDATVKYDSSEADARRSRNAMLARAAAAHQLVGAAHVSFPGLGHVRRGDAGYEWMPLNYQGDPVNPY